MFVVPNEWHTMCRLLHRPLICVSRSDRAAGARRPRAWIFTGSADGTLHVSADREHDVERPLLLTLPSDGKIRAGASGEVDGNGPKKGFSGAIARVRLHDTARTRAGLRRGAEGGRAFLPMPRDGATPDFFPASLRWQSGAEQATRPPSVLRAFPSSPA